MPDRAAVVTRLVPRQNQRVRSGQRRVINIGPVRMFLVAGFLTLAIWAYFLAGPGQSFPPPPRNPPIVLPVTISPDGKVITVRAAKPCGHRPLLIARSYRRLVTLRLVNQDAGNCHVEAVPVTEVTVTLQAPLGTRRLVQAATGKLIKYHVVSPSPRPVRSSPRSGTQRAAAGSKSRRSASNVGVSSAPLGPERR
jgi:hypothetical protein